MTIDDDLKFIETNIERLAEIADGNIIDPNVRPKDKRLWWTTKSYTADVLKGMEWWLKQEDWMKKKYLHSVKDYAMQAFNGEDAEQRVRWIYSILVAHPDPKIEAEDAARRERRHRIQTEQENMAEFDIQRKCTECGKFLFEYDEKNNKRHNKDEVCTCGGDEGAQKKMKANIADYRKDLDDRKRSKKK